MSPLDRAGGLLILLGFAGLFWAHQKHSKEGEWVACGIAIAGVLILMATGWGS